MQKRNGLWYEQGMENKIIDIETTLAHHDQQIAEMSEIITDQWKQIETLNRKLLRLGDKMEQMGNDRGQEDSSIDSIERARQEIPPHH